MTKRSMTATSMRAVTRRSLVLLLAVALSSGTAAAAAHAAEDALTDAKRAYEAAAYEDALRLLEPLSSAEARQYAALCLLALGRADAAAHTIEAMITAAPLFTPSSTEVPPRFATLVNETRRKILPVVARKAFTDGRERFNAKQIAEAMPHFELALQLSDDPLWRGTPDAQDLRTLADGFAQLARASLPPPPPAPDAAAPPVTASRPRAAAVPPKVTLPRPIREGVPPLPANLSRTAGPVATLKLLIGPDGRVLSASVDQSAHPRYDEILLNASSEWLYEPGTLDGKPVPSERVLNVRLR